MERKAIYFDGDVDIKEFKEFLETIPKGSGATDIVIGGGLMKDDFFYEDWLLEVPANLWVLKNIEADGFCTIKIHGDLYCAGNVDAYYFIVKDDFTCKGDVDINSAEVGGDIAFKGNVKSYGGEIKCFGDFTCYGNCNANVLVGGFFLCEGEFTGEVKKL